MSFDTQNPDGDEGPLVHRLAAELAALGAAAVDEVAVGEHAYVYARFGAAPPKLLLNAHVDTVPANSGYSTPPHLLVRRGSRLHGLGAADTKGAIAAILEALAEPKNDVPLDAALTQALIELGDVQATAKGLESKSPQVRRAVLAALANLPDSGLKASDVAKFFSDPFPSFFP